VDNRAQHHLDKGARILMATPGGGGYGRAVDRKVDHKLEDEILGYMTEE
jgi:N-methylhydantoinase B/oxoprolinase/acetone carboxylase alpha subunit|tara:strand:+ start:114 stop:260 length:147 start_codon:yes stop_codon:yes gene_type:complete